MAAFAGQVYHWNRAWARSTPRLMPESPQQLADRFLVGAVMDTAQHAVRWPLPGGRVRLPRRPHLCRPAGRQRGGQGQGRGRGEGKLPRPKPPPGPGEGRDIDNLPPISAQAALSRHRWTRRRRGPDGGRVRTDCRSHPAAGPRRRAGPRKPVSGSRSSCGGRGGRATAAAPRSPAPPEALRVAASRRRGHHRVRLRITRSPALAA